MAKIKKIKADQVEQSPEPAITIEAKASLPELLNVPLSDITPDPNQPRIIFDEAALAELAADIVENGLNQPITLRRLPDGKFMIVTGERRYRACVMAGLMEITAMVRELDDEKTLIVQIGENIQRRDMHPMEEAKAYKRLLSFKHTDIKEIAAKMAKSESYITKRLKLNDLTEPWQEIYFAGKMNHSQSLALSRISADLQDEVYAEKVGDADWRAHDYVLQNIDWYLERSVKDIRKAAFDTSDCNLYPEAGACTKCPYNSGNAPIMFEEMKSSVCNKPSCFAIKTQRNEKNKLQELKDNPDMLVIARHYEYDDARKEKVSRAKEMGINILDDKYYEVLDEPESIQSFDEWFEENGDEDDAPEYSRSEYDDYVKDAKSQWDGYQAKLSTWDVKKAYMLTSYHDEGKVMNIVLKESTPKNIDNGEGFTSPEVEKIEAKEKRAKELDAEKVWEKVRELVKNDSDGLLRSTGAILGGQYHILAEAIKSKINYQNRHWIEFLNGKAAIEKSDINVLLRALILDALVTAFGSHLNNGHNKLAFEYINSIFPDQIKEVEEAQALVTKKREARVAGKIAGLSK